MQTLSRAKSPELQGMKLIKSMLKKESEESEQPMTLPSSDLVYPRSILKSNSYSRPIHTTSVNDAVLSRSERGSCSQNSETAKFPEVLDLTTTNHNTIRDPCDEMRATVSKQGVNMENEAVVPSHKTAAKLFRNKQILPADVDDCNIDTMSSSVLERCSTKDYSLAGKSNRISMLDIDDDNNDHDNKDNKKENDNNDDEDNERDVSKKEERSATKVKVKRNDDADDDDSHICNTTVDKKLATSVAQCAINSLTKSISQHSVGDERWKQHGLPLPELCRSATQVITSIETSETPSVSIADRLAALHHSGSTNWKRRVLGTRHDESHDDALPLTSQEENTVKSGVLADCIEKLESAAESWKSRIVTPDAINFTVAGKMKVIPSKGANSSFLTETTVNLSNQKKKVPRQWFKVRKDKGESFSIRTNMKL